MKKVICIGSATRDINVQLRKGRKIEVSENGLLAFELGAKEYLDGFSEELGGSAVNVGTGLVLQEIKPFIFSRTAKDWIGKWIVKQIGKRKLKKNYMQQNGNMESETAIVIFDKEKQDRVILRAGDAVERCDLEKALKRFREKAHWVYIASQKKGWVEKMEKTVEFAKKKKAKFAINPSNFQIRDDAKKLAGFFKEAEVVFLNKTESLELIQNVGIKMETQEDKEVLKQVAEFGAKITVVTDGRRGAFVRAGGKSFHVLGQKIDAHDTTGAGDAFCSGFLSGLIHTEDVKMAAKWGIAQSAAVIQKVGATNGLLKLGQIKKRAEKVDIKEI